MSLIPSTFSLRWLIATHFSPISSSSSSSPSSPSSHLTKKRGAVIRFAALLRCNERRRQTPIAPHEATGCLFYATHYHPLHFIFFVFYSTIMYGSDQQITHQVGGSHVDGYPLALVEVVGLTGSGIMLFFHPPIISLSIESIPYSRGGIGISGFGF